MISRDQELMKSIYIQLINGLSLLHNGPAGHAHMDIKLENVLINGQGELKFCDFGFSLPVQDLVCKRVGTENYMAPEIYDAKNMPCQASKTDIFSLGVLFFIIAFGAPPFLSAQ